eukprot:5998402-Alexandrium_andersonii.AAC.1
MLARNEGLRQLASDNAQERNSARNGRRRLRTEINRARRGELRGRGVPAQKHTRGSTICTRSTHAVR